MIDVLTQESTDPELPGFWFNPRTDTPVMYHNRHHQGMQELVVRRSSLYGRLVQATAILDPQVQPWPVCRRPECPHGPLGHGVPAVRACRWKNPLIVVDVIAIQTSNKAARQSGLFGLLGDEPIQLVLVDDKNRLEEYWEFMGEAMEAGREQTQSTLEWCNYVMDGSCFLDFLAWVAEARTREVWRAWKDAERARFEGITGPWDIWRVRGEQEALDMLDPASFARGRSEFNMEKFWTSKKHPWVQGVLTGLPSFRACLMIRHCADETCLDCPERGDEAWEEKEERWRV